MGHEWHVKLIDTCGQTRPVSICYVLLKVVIASSCTYFKMHNDGLFLRFCQTVQLQNAFNFPNPSEYLVQCTESQASIFNLHEKLATSQFDYVLTVNSNEFSKLLMVYTMHSYILHMIPPTLSRYVFKTDCVM